MTLLAHLLSDDVPHGFELGVVPASGSLVDASFVASAVLCDPSLAAPFLSISSHGQSNHLKVRMRPTLTVKPKMFNDKRVIYFLSIISASTTLRPLGEFCDFLRDSHQ